MGLCWLGVTLGESLKELNDSSQGDTVAGVDVMGTGATAAEIRGVGQRVTALRVTVLELLQSKPHLTAEALLRESQLRLGALSLQGLYDSLRVMEAASLVRRIQPSGGSALYERRVKDNHHHLVCRACRAVADVACTVGHSPCLTPMRNAGYLVDEAEVVFWGLCSVCQESPSPAALARVHDTTTTLKRGSAAKGES